MLCDCTPPPRVTFGLSLFTLRFVFMHTVDDLQRKHDEKMPFYCGGLDKAKLLTVFSGAHYNTSH